MTALFQEVETKEAFGVLAERGIPELCRIFDELADTEKNQPLDDLLFVLKILAMYRTEAGTERVIRAARMPLNPAAYMWSVVLRQYDKDHPCAMRVFRELAEPLPQGFLAVALLDSANNYAIHVPCAVHPFDSAEGRQRLRAWFTSRDEDEYSYAHSAAASIPFISGPEREQLLALALDHPSVDVQLEAAWASAKLGSEAGLKVLARYCLDPNYSERARQYLSEIGREDAIPHVALDPDFRAKATFANWLAHPNELGRVPDELQIVDEREIAWPPSGERKPFWLLKYRVKNRTGLEEDEVDCGLVGSVTFCLFSYKLAERAPEDAYAIHCYWEMQVQKLIRDVEVEEGGESYESMLQQWSGEPLTDPEIICVAEISPELKYSQKVVALATANLGGREGWVVLDGRWSTWYPKNDMPAEAPPKTVLMVHVGRRLLGFDAQPDRQSLLVKPYSKRAPQQIIEAYENLLTQAIAGEENQERKIDSHGPLGKHFEQYVDALIATAQCARIDSVIEKLAPYWDHNSGYGKIGMAGFRCGRFAIAERCFERLRQSCQDWPRSEEMSFLAEIWANQGRVDDAHSLLVECLKRLLEESKTATGSGRKLFEKWFQQHRATYLRLFPDRGETILEKNGIPPTTRR